MFVIRNQNIEKLVQLNFDQLTTLGYLQTN